MDVEVLAQVVVNEVEMKIADDVPNRANNAQAPAAAANEQAANQQNNNAERRRP